MNEVDQKHLEGVLGNIALNGDTRELLPRLEEVCQANEMVAPLYRALREHAPLTRNVFKIVLNEEGVHTPQQIVGNLSVYDRCYINACRDEELVPFADSAIDGWNKRADLEKAAVFASQGDIERTKAYLESAKADAVEATPFHKKAYIEKQKEEGLIAPTQIGIAQFLADTYRNALLYASQWKRWLRWDGKRWAVINDNAESRVVIDFLRFDLLAYAGAIADDTKRAEMVKFAGKCQNDGAVRDIASLAQSLLAVDVSTLDSKPNLLNLQNGTLDLNTFQVRPHDPADRLTKVCNASYSSDKGEGEVWAGFLSKIIPDDKVREYLAKAVGYSLTSDVSQEKMFLLFGGGRNGKTTFINAVSHVLGDYAVQGDQQLLTYKPSALKGNNSDAVADLQGRRFVSVSETADGDRLDESRVKDIVSNKAINAMRKYERPFTFQPTHKVWLDTNHRPKVKGTDDGIWRRLALIPFTVQIPHDDIDHDLRAKLEGEADAIFGWAVNGLKEYRDRGLIEPTTIREAGAEYQAESDTVRQFVAECLVKAPGEQLGKMDTYRAYKAWLEQNGHTAYLTTMLFNKRLIELGFVEARIKNERVWKDKAFAGSTSGVSTPDTRPF